MVVVLVGIKIPLSRRCRSGCVLRIHLLRERCLRDVPRRRIGRVNQPRILRPSHHIAEAEKYGAKEYYAEKQSHKVPAFEHPVTAAAPCRSSRHSCLYFGPSVLAHCAIKSIGKGKIIVVFFSTPISVRVCKYRS